MGRLAGMSWRSGACCRVSSVTAFPSARDDGGPPLQGPRDAELCQVGAAVQARLRAAFPDADGEVLLSALLVAHLDYGAAHKARLALCSAQAAGHACAHVTARTARGRALCEQRRAPLDWARPQADSALSCPGWELCTGRTSPCPCLQLCSASAAAEAAAAHRADAAPACTRGPPAPAARRRAPPRRARRCRRRRRRRQCSRAWRRSRRPRRSPSARPLRAARAGGARRHTSRHRRPPSAAASSSRSTRCRRARRHRPSGPGSAGACTGGPAARVRAHLLAPAAGMAQARRPLRVCMQAEAVRPASP